MKRGAPSVDKDAIATYFAQQTDVVAAYLFGSVARDQAGHLSDVDVAVLLVPALELEASVERQLHLMVALDDFADRAGREVQVTILNRASPVLAYQVVRDGILLYERSQLERVAFEVRTMKVYFDVKPMLEFHFHGIIHPQSQSHQAFDPWRRVAECGGLLGPPDPS